MTFDCACCKHFDSNDKFPPCSECKGTCPIDSEEYKTRPLLFEDYDDEEERIATGAALPRNDNEEDAVDMVNRPPHYTHGQYECIDVMVDTFGKEAVQHFCLLNAFKYVWRSEHKNGIEDVKKAWWYLDKYLQLEVEKHD